MKIKQIKIWLKKNIKQLFLNCTKSKHRAHKNLQKHLRWEYKVVQMVTQAPPDPDDASRKLKGSLSGKSLRDQFPEYYSPKNSRQQINDFLNLLGEDGWELIEIQNIAELPLMVFKRPNYMPKRELSAKSIEDDETKHGKQ